MAGYLKPFSGSRWRGMEAAITVAARVRRPSWEVESRGTIGPCPYSEERL
jgi:hypothetical protein